MPVLVDTQKCDGCGICVERCPGDVFVLDREKRAVAKYPEDCIYCILCEFDCPPNAIKVKAPKEWGWS